MGIDGSSSKSNYLFKQKNVGLNKAGISFYQCNISKLQSHNFPENKQARLNYPSVNRKADFDVKIT